MRDYEQARGVAFARSEVAEIEAGATYARAYKARCEHAIDPEAARWSGSSRESLQANGPFHFQRGRARKPPISLSVFALALRCATMGASRAKNAGLGGAC